MNFRQKTTINGYRFIDQIKKNYGNCRLKINPRSMEKKFSFSFFFHYVNLYFVANYKSSGNEIKKNTILGN